MKKITIMLLFAALSWFSHLAFEIPGDDTSSVWLGPVDDEEYERLK